METSAVLKEYLQHSVPKTAALKSRHKDSSCRKRNAAAQLGGCGLEARGDGVAVVAGAAGPSLDTSCHNLKNSKEIGVRTCPA